MRVSSNGNLLIVKTKQGSKSVVTVSFYVTYDSKGAHIYIQPLFVYLHLYFYPTINY